MVPVGAELLPSAHGKTDASLEEKAPIYSATGALLERTAYSWNFKFLPCQLVCCSLCFSVILCDSLSDAGFSVSVDFTSTLGDMSLLSDSFVHSQSPPPYPLALSVDLC